MTTAARFTTPDELLAHASWVRALAKSLVSDPNLADDVGQEAMAQALEKPPRHRGALRAWFARVVRRRIFDHLRAEGRRTRREAAAATTARSDAAPEDVLVRAETRARIAREVLALEEPYRTAILLRFFEEMPAKAVAEFLRVPEATVRTRLGRGLARLRERLERPLGPEGGARQWGLLLVADVARPLNGAATVKGGLIMAMSAKKVAAAAAVLLLAGGYAVYEVVGGGAPAPTNETAPVEVSSAPPRAPNAPGLATAPVAPRESTGSGGAVEPATKPASAGPIRTGGPLPEGVIAGLVHDESAGALTGVLVLLWDEAGRSVVSRATTDAEGRFRIEGISGAERPISFHAYARARVSGKIPVGKALDVTLSAGESADELKSLRGLVVEEKTGLALEAVPVAAVLSANPGSAVAAAVVTDKDGVFEFRGLAAGSWKLRVGLFSGYAEGPGAEYVAKVAGPFDVGAEGVRVELARGLAITGEILGQDGRPWTGGATVRSHAVSAAGAVDYDRIRTVHASDAGAFRIPGLYPGLYDLTVEAAGGASGAPSGGVVHVGQVSAGTGGLVVHLERGLPLTGRLLDEHDRPIVANGWVWVFEVGRRPGEPGSVAAKLLGDGRFETPPLDAARAVGVKAMGFPGYGVGEIAGVHPGDPNLVIRLPAGQRIAGRVVDAEGKPVGALVPVTCAAEDFDPAHPAPGLLAFATTDAKGEFVCAGLKDARYILAAGGGASGWLSAGVIPGIKPTVDPVTLRVERGVPFSGRLVDSRGFAVAYVDIQARAAAGQMGAAPTARTDADGHFSFAGVSKGRVALAATIHGAWTQLGSFDAPGTDAKVTVPP